jgi:hypothetical protein
MVEALNGAWHAAYVHADFWPLEVSIFLYDLFLCLFFLCIAGGQQLERLQSIDLEVREQWKELLEKEWSRREIASQLNLPSHGEWLVTLNNLHRF